MRLDRPSFGFTTTVTSVLGYRAIARGTGATRLHTTVEAKGSAGVSDAFLGTKRLRLAEEASIRANAVIRRNRARATPVPPRTNKGAGHLGAPFHMLLFGNDLFYRDGGI